MTTTQDTIARLWERLEARRLVDGYVPAYIAGWNRMIDNTLADLAALSVPNHSSVGRTDGGALPQDRYGETSVDRVRDFAENGVMPPQNRDDLRAILALLPTVPAGVSEDGDARYLITKASAYYRANAQGYTRSRDEAGHYSLAEAVFHSHPNGPTGPRDGITYEPALVSPSPDTPEIEGRGAA